jgi:class 3 adenylate cyclase
VPLDHLPTLEQRMDDVRVVMDAADSDRAVLFGHSEGGPMCTLFAAAFPERVTALIMYGSFASRLRRPDHPWGPTSDERERYITSVGEAWGGPVDLPDLAPSLVDDEGFATWWARFLRASTSPAAAMALTRMNSQVDVRQVLPTIRVPTLIIHRTSDRDVDVGGARWMADQIPDAQYVEIPGDDHLIWADPDPIVDIVERFVTGVTPAAVPDRVLLTVVFTDIVDSTTKAADLGDREWTALLDRHDAIVHEQVQRHRGRVVKTLGDGVMAVFDGPARAVRCAQSLVRELRPLGLELRGGVHTGEVEIRGDDVGGLGVHIAARIAAEAGPREVVASRTVKDLVAGSGIVFDAPTTHELKGIPGTWDLHRTS